MRRRLKKIDLKALLKKKKVIVALSICLFIILYNLISGYQDRASYSLLMLKNYFAGKGYKGYVQYTVMTHIDNNLHLKLEIAVPYSNSGQAEVLAKNTPRIMNELIVTIGDYENRQVVSKRRYSELRKHLLKVINRYTTEPVETVYYKTILLM